MSGDDVNLHSHKNIKGKCTSSKLIIQLLMIILNGMHGETISVIYCYSYESRKVLIVRESERICPP